MMASISRITHLTSAHPRYDTRIFHKMCRSLANHDYSVNLVVADGEGFEVRDGVNIIDAGASKGRFNRIRYAPDRVFAKAVALESDLYHLHDPELIPIGMKLKKLGKLVIFDSHEDVPMQMLDKPYLTRSIRWGIAQGLRLYEIWACKKFDGIIAATPFIRNKFLSINQNSIDINNYPLLDELSFTTRWIQKQPLVSYVGGIDVIRGCIEVIQALGLIQTDSRLQLVGQFSEGDLQQRLKELSGWKHVDVLGYLDRSRVLEVLTSSIAGLVTYLPLPNHINAQPNKLFEYMSAAIPVIASDFPLWREIVAGNDCGLLVDPQNPAKIAEAIDYLVTHPEDAERMGRNGYNAVLERYNWPHEEKKLLGFYQRILSS